MMPHSRDAQGDASQPLLAGPREHDVDNVNNTTTTTRSGLPVDPKSERGAFKANLGAKEAFAIVVSIVIGSGVFTSPGVIDTNSPSPAIALLAWIAAGVLAWTGAMTMAELGTAIPGEGGVQPYLQYIFGDVYGFLAGWTWIVAGMPATLAILSIVFVESIFSAAGVTDQAETLGHKLLSISILVVMNVANSISTKASTRLNNFFVFTKFVAIACVVGAGVAVVAIHLANPDKDVGGGDWYSKSWFSYRTTVAPDGSTVPWDDLSSWEILGHFSAALYGALWAYCGWDKAIYVSAELSQPARQLPLAINTAIPTIIGCFIAANAAYYILLPWSVVSSTDSVAVTAVGRLLGPAAGTVAAVLICLVVAGSLLGNAFVVGRMTVAASRKGWFPRCFSMLGSVGLRPKETVDPDSSDAPLNATILSTVLTSLYILLATSGLFSPSPGWEITPGSS
ncbi:b(0-+)-type amino acid transporter 1 [Apiospora arundinis]